MASAASTDGAGAHSGGGNATGAMITAGAGWEAAFRRLCLAASLVLMIGLGALILSLAIGGWPAFARFGPAFLVTNVWDPVSDQFGAAGPIVGTLVTASLALLMALPLAIGVAIFLTEFCPPRIAQPLGVAVELLAGIPSIVYGMWGLFVLAPWFAGHVQGPLAASAEPGSLLAGVLAGVPNGANIFTASLVLAIMILPYIASVFRELLLAVPAQMREAAYGIGCTSYEVIGSIMIPYVRRSAIGAVMLGLGRALGETMAVTFIIGNSHAFPKGLFDAGSTIASTIANEFTEATDELHVASLFALGLVLFVITFASIAGARLLLIGERVR